MSQPDRCALDSLVFDVIALVSGVCEAVDEAIISLSVPPRKS